MLYFELILFNRQHIQGKPKATGLKLYLLADNNRYVWDFWIYQGHQGILF